MVTLRSINDQAGFFAQAAQSVDIKMMRIKQCRTVSFTAMNKVETLTPVMYTKILRGADRTGQPSSCTDFGRLSGNLILSDDGMPERPTSMNYTMKTKKCISSRAKLTGHLC